ncbi:MAG: hypothetical protein LBS90_03650 [Oscillospiraceae bacterium]|nr:hypothetical protein [Oscillospiraceae bacterium]
MTTAKRETVKTCLILLLSVSAFALGRFSGIFGDVFSPFASGKTAPATPDYAGGIAVEAARPVEIVFTAESGERYTGYGDAAARAALYELTAAAVGSAVARADDPSPCTEDEWRGALLSPGIAYRYYAPMRLGVLAAWLGSGGVTDGTEVRGIVLRFSDGSLFFETRDGWLAAAGEAPEPPSVSGTAAENALYLFERYPGSASPYLLDRSGMTVAALTAASPLADEAKRAETLNALGVLPGINAGYTDADGAEVYVLPAFTVMLGGDGSVTYSRTDEPASGASRTAEEEIEIARLAVRFCSDNAGAASFMCVGYASDGGVATVTFEYFVYGMRVSARLGAVVTLAGGRVRTIDALPLEFTRAAASVTLLSPALASAAETSEIEPAYRGMTASYFAPYWRVSG